MILKMIGADGKHRRIPLDNSAGSIQGVQFSTLDVDLYVGRLRAGKNLVKSDAVDHHATLADRGGFVSIAGERHRSGVCPHGRALSVMDSRSGRRATSFSSLSKLAGSGSKL